jgi:hypothetical protein
MSTFYVLPPRPLLGRHFAGFLQEYFPDLQWRADQHAALAEALAATASSQSDVVVVFREDLPQGEEMPGVLLSDFGAEAGDEIVQVGPTALQRWRIGSR